MVSQTKFHLGAALCLLLLGGGAVAGSTSITCCEDENGRRICADVLPPACYGKAYREIGPQGNVTRLVPAPMTAEERARVEQEEKARKALEGKAREQRRRDEALFQTYSSLEDLETRRERAVAEIEKDLTVAYRRETAAGERRVKLEQEAGAYTSAKKPVPAPLASQLEENEGEMTAQRSIMASKQRDLEAVKARYDADRRRYGELLAEKASRR
jgi:hypothetical protein